MSDTNSYHVIVTSFNWCLICVSSFVLVLLLTTPLASPADLCPKECACHHLPGDPPWVNCSDSRKPLRHIPLMLNPRITKLILRGNVIDRVKADEFTMYSELVELDLSSNAVSTLPQGAFRRLKRLETLLLNDNKIGGAPESLPSWRAPFKSLSSLKKLDLSRNEIKRLDQPLDEVSLSQLADSGTLINLKHLNLSKNLIEEITVSSFTGLRSIATLDLSFNRISSLRMEPGKYLIDGLSHLTLLNLRGNQLRTLEPSTFRSLRSLSHLLLDDNYLSALPTDPFGDAKHFNFTEVTLTDNHQPKFHTSSLTKLGHLKVLSMSGNAPLTCLPSEGFAGLDNLERLSISNCNQLTEVATSAFAGLNNLQSLDLSNNPKLTVIDPFLFGTVDELSSLQIVNVSRTNLSTIPSILLTSPSLTVLDASHNRFDCSCGFVESIVTVLQSNAIRSLSLTSSHCASPNLFEFMDLDKLSAVEVALCQTAPGAAATGKVPRLANGKLAAAILGALAGLCVMTCLASAFCCLYRRRMCIFAEKNPQDKLVPGSLKPRRFETAKPSPAKSKNVRLAPPEGSRDKGKSTPWYKGCVWSSLERRSFLSTSEANESNIMFYPDQTFDNNDGQNSKSYGQNTGAEPDVSRNSSFKVLAKYPVPITEL